MPVVATHVTSAVLYLNVIAVSRPPSKQLAAYRYLTIAEARLYDAVSLLRAEFGPFIRDYSRWVQTKLAEEDDGESARRQS